MGLTVVKTSATAHSWVITANTGRAEKTYKSRVKTTVSGENDSAETTYVQAGKSEFVALVTSSTPSIGKDETSLVITLVSNSKKLNAAFVSNGMDASIASMTINGDAYTNNTNILGDPGNNAEYTAVITLSFKANNMASTRSFQLQVTDNGGHAVTVTGTQAGQTPTITVDPSTVQVSAAGGSGSITVSSNDTWTVSDVTGQEQNAQQS